MKALLQNTINFIKRGIGLVPHASSPSKTDAIVSGYSISQRGERSRCSANALDHKPVGILYADIVDYARLSEQDEDGTHLRLVESMKIFKAHVAANRGKVAHFAGDAILVRFKDADSALNCAISVQLAVKQWNEGLRPDQYIQYRIGVNFGDAIIDQDDIYGNAVNLAARLEKLAVSGGICVSESVRAKLEDHSSFRFVGMGKQYVKNISEPVQAFWIEIDSHQLVDASLTGAVKVSAVAS